MQASESSSDGMTKGALHRAPLTPDNGSFLAVASFADFRPLGRYSINMRRDVERRLLQTAVALACVLTADRREWDLGPAINSASHPFQTKGVMSAFDPKQTLQTPTHGVNITTKGALS